MTKLFTDGATTLTASNLNKHLAGDGTVGTNAGGFACWGLYVYWVSGTTFAASTVVGSVGNYDKAVFSFSAGFLTIDLTNCLPRPLAGIRPVVQCTQGKVGTSYTIQAEADSATQVQVKFFSVGASPALVTTADQHMKFNLLLWYEISP